MSYTIKQSIGLALAVALIAAIPFSSTVAQDFNKRASLTNSVTGSSIADRMTDSDQREQNPAKLFAGARSLFVFSRTAFVKQEVIESELLKRDDFRQSELLITKNEQGADLVLTVRRSNFTTEYPYDIVDQRTGLVVGGGKVNSLFGTAAGKIAKGFTKQLQLARSTVPAKP